MHFVSSSVMIDNVYTNAILTLLVFSLTTRTMNSIITVRVDPKKKRAAQKILERLGLDLSSMVKMSLEQVIATESVPFSVATKQGHELRYAKTLRKEIEWTLRHAKRYKTAEEMHADILKK